jgi:hypothetical protein
MQDLSLPFMLMELVDHLTQLLQVSNLVSFFQNQEALYLNVELV